MPRLIESIDICFMFEFATRRRRVYFLLRCHRLICYNLLVRKLRQGDRLLSLVPNVALSVQPRRKPFLVVELEWFCKVEEAIWDVAKRVE